jgi:hypothetical protein
MLCLSVRSTRATRPVHFIFLDLIAFNPLNRKKKHDRKNKDNRKAKAKQQTKGINSVAKQNVKEFWTKRK